MSIVEINVDDFKAAPSPIKQRPAVFERLANSPKKTTTPEAIKRRQALADERRQSFEAEKVARARRFAATNKENTSELLSETSTGCVVNVDFKGPSTPQRKQRPAVFERLANSPKRVTTPEHLKRRQDLAEERRMSLEADKVAAAKAEVTKAKHRAELKKDGVIPGSPMKPTERPQ